MGALSDDPVLLELYSQDDLYKAIALKLFNDSQQRKHAKRLFLSWAYGMRRKNLMDAAINLGSTKEKAKETFDQFEVFEEWKSRLGAELKKLRRVGTENGNFFTFSTIINPRQKTCVQLLVRRRRELVL